LLEVDVAQVREGLVGGAPDQHELHGVSLSLCLAGPRGLGIHRSNGPGAGSTRAPKLFEIFCYRSSEGRSKAEQTGGDWKTTVCATIPSTTVNTCRVCKRSTPSASGA